MKHNLTLLQKTNAYLEHVVPQSRRALKNEKMLLETVDNKALGVEVANLQADLKESDLKNKVLEHCLSKTEQNLKSKTQQYLDTKHACVAIKQKYHEAERTDKLLSK